MVVLYEKMWLESHTQKLSISESIIADPLGVSDLLLLLKMEKKKFHILESP